MSEAGLWAAEAYAAWALFLLLGCLGVHLGVGVLYLVGWSRPRARRWRLLVEFVYGFVNPILYLLVFQPALFRRWTPGWLPWVCWAAFTAYWGMRLFGASRRTGALPPRQWGRAVLVFSGVLMAALLVRDGAVALAGAIVVGKPILYGGGDELLALLCLPLYLLPGLAVARHLVVAVSEERWRDGDFAILRGRPWWLAAVFGVLTTVAVVATSPSRSEAEVRESLVRHRASIVSESRRHRLDPRLLAAIIEVTQRDLAPPFRSRLEEFVADVWLVDSSSGLLLAEAFDPSLGLAQVKANTALTALAIRYLSEPGARQWLSKDYRSVKVLGRAELDRIPSAALRHVGLPGTEPLPSKREVVLALKTPSGNFAHAAFLLDLLASQWEAVDASWAIRDRADIMATLFQLGFAHSLPKPYPMPNDFGLKVQAAFDDPWMEATFGKSGLASAAPDSPYLDYPDTECSLFRVASTDRCWLRLAQLCSKENGGPALAVVVEEGVSWPRRGACRYDDPEDGGTHRVLVIPEDDRDNGLGAFALSMRVETEPDGGQQLHTVIGANPARTWLPDGGRLYSTVLCGFCDTPVEKTTEGWRGAAPGPRN